MEKSALVLFAHGARDPRWAEPFERLRALVAAGAPDGVQVRLAFLEFMAPNLPDLAGELAAQGCAALALVPVFLGQGGHVLRDLPPMVERLRLAHPGMEFSVAGAVGEDAEVQRAMARCCLNAIAGLGGGKAP